MSLRFMKLNAQTRKLIRIWAWRLAVSFMIPVVLVFGYLTTLAILVGAEARGHRLCSLMTLHAYAIPSNHLATVPALGRVSRAYLRLCLRFTAGRDNLVYKAFPKE